MTHFTPWRFGAIFAASQERVAALAALQSGKLDLPAEATVAAVVCDIGSDGIAS